MTHQTTQARAERHLPTPEDLIDRAIGLGPLLRARARHCEEMRRVPDETIADFTEAGFFDVLKPARYRGLELDPIVFLRICIEVARHCGSSAWVLGILGAHNWRLALFPDEAAADVWLRSVEPSPLVAASTPPSGTVTRVEGGYRISGRWPFASGIDHCGWACLAVTTPPAGEGQPPFQYLFLVPRSDYEVEDVWHAAGLKGTGTNVVVVRDAFVPSCRTSSEAAAATLRRDPACTNTGPLYRYPWGLILSYVIAAPAIGMAEAAYAEYLDFVRRKAATAEDGEHNRHSHLLIARTRTTLDCIHAALDRNFAELSDIIRLDGEPSLDLRARCRWEASWMTECCAESVRMIFEAMRATAIFEDHPIQRLFRDVHVLKAHRINNVETTGDNFGRLQAGLSNREVFL